MTVDVKDGTPMVEKSSELVSVGEFPEPMEAEMVKLRLESAGIDTYMSGENAAILAPGLGPLELQVRSEDESDARAIIADAGEGLPDESADDGGDRPVDEQLQTR
jgi:Putative prokaryotic signal transducing protein